jgi:hypothetical protein
MIKSIRVAGAAVGLFCAVFAGATLAAPLFYDFFVHFTTGPLAGQTFTGDIAVDGNDCPGNICTGTFAPNDPARTLLSLDITVASVSFTASDDSGFDTFPRAGFDASGQFNFLDYDGLVGGNELAVFGNLRNGTAAAAFDPATGLTSLGTAAAAPEPGTVSLLGGALLAALALARRHKL